MSSQWQPGHTATSESFTLTPQFPSPPLSFFELVLPPSMCQCAVTLSQRAVVFEARKVDMCGVGWSQALPTYLMMKPRSLDIWHEVEKYLHVFLTRELPLIFAPQHIRSVSHGDRTQPKYKPSQAVCSRWNWICCVFAGKMAGLLPPHLALIFSVCSGSWAKLGRTVCVKVSYQLPDTQMPVICQQSHVSRCSRGICSVYFLWVVPFSLGRTRKMCGI